VTQAMMGMVRLEYRGFGAGLGSKNLTIWLFLFIGGG
jgi:hypothetical protein